MDKIKVLVIDDDLEFNTVLTRELGKSGFEVNSLVDGSECRQYLRNNSVDVILLDVQMPGKDGIQILEEVRREFKDIQVIMLTGFGTIDSAIKAVKIGAFDFLTKPADLERIESTISKAFEMSRLVEQNRMLKQSLSKPPGAKGLIGTSEPIQKLRKFISRAAPTNSCVLIYGESGVGKEVVAREIHQASKLSDQPLVIVDCSSLQENLLASELFGNEKGAFTGATNLKHGLFEIADKGTMFLDEVGEMSPSIQVKLLRVLETGQFRRLGGNRDITVNVRIIAATNKELKHEMDEGCFREDLFYRLNVLNLTIPPLREHTEDIDLLVDHFMKTLSDAEGNQKNVSPEVLKLFREYEWPGNVRELRNILERLVIMSSNDEILAEELPVEFSNKDISPIKKSFDNLQSLKDIETEYIEHVLNITDGNRQKTAAILGIDPKTLYRKLNPHNRA